VRLPPRRRCAHDPGVAKGDTLALLLLVAPILSLLALAAHFLRSGNLLMVVAALALIGCLAARRPWVPRLSQAALALGAIVWIVTAALLAKERIRMGEPYIRMVVILGGVAILCAGSALLFETALLRRRYRRVADAGSVAPP
jgi:peptidoglycan/LPS O-acetylase OafA/YrhL